MASTGEMTLCSARNVALSLIVATAACTGVIGSDDGADGPGPQGQGAGLPVTDTVGHTPLRRMTRAQYDNTIRDLLHIDSAPASSFAPDEIVGAFHSNAVAPPSELDVENYMTVAESLAIEATLDLPSLLPCDPAAIGQRQCADAFIETFGMQAYRRPLSAGEKAQLQSVYELGAQTDFVSGIRLVVQTALQSPFFLYLVEPEAEGDEVMVKLDGYALASRLSYFLWSSMPDDALFEAAESGALDSDEGLQAQAERMLSDDRARASVASFHVQWLNLTELEFVEKDPLVFPQWDAALREAMLKETEDFADHVIRKGDGRLETLLTSNESFPSGALGTLYGVTPAGASPTALDPTELDPTERSGLLTHASVLSVHAHTDQTSPIHRGALVRTNLMCQVLPAAPENVDNVPPDPDPNATTRERFAEHTNNPECAACHKLIDGVGLGFENYDAIGAFRVTENGLDVDASGEIVAAPGIEGPFDGVIELSQILSTSDVVRACVASQWFRYAFGRVEGDDDEAHLELLNEAFAASDFNVRQLMIDVVLSDAFKFRRRTQGGTP